MAAGMCKLGRPTHRPPAYLLYLILVASLGSGGNVLLFAIAVKITQPTLWVELCPPPNSYVEVLTQVPQNATLFRNKVIADVIS